MGVKLSGYSVATLPTDFHTNFKKALASTFGDKKTTADDFTIIDIRDATGGRRRRQLLASGVVVDYHYQTTDSTKFEAVKTMAQKETFGTLLKQKATATGMDKLGEVQATKAPVSQELTGAAVNNEPQQKTCANFNCQGSLFSLKDNAALRICAGGACSKKICCDEAQKVFMPCHVPNVGIQESYTLAKETPLLKWKHDLNSRLKFYNATSGTLMNKKVPTWFNLGDTERFLGEVNRILGGVAVTQSRYKTVTCELERSTLLNSVNLGLRPDRKRSIEGLKTECMEEGETSTKAFGADPAFMPTQLGESIYNFDVAASKLKFYNQSQRPNEFHPDHADKTIISRSGQPYGFHHLKHYLCPKKEKVDVGDGKKEYKCPFYETLSGSYAPKGYLVYWDTQLKRAQALKFMRYIQNGFFLDEYTSTVDVDIMTYNANMRMFAYTHVEFKIGPTGVIGMTFKISMEKYSYYATNSDVIRFFLEITSLIFVIIQIGGEFYEIREVGWRSYFTSFWNVLDWAHLLMLAGLICNWWYVNQYLIEDFMPKTRYGVLQDLSAKGRFLAINNTAKHEQLRSFLDDVGYLKLVSNNLGMHLFAQMLAILLFVVRLIKYLDFQVRDWARRYLIVLREKGAFVNLRPRSCF